MNTIKAIRSSLLPAAALIALSLAPPANADFTVNASANATVPVFGIIPNSNGENFLNVDGSNNLAFSSFGVLDFAVPAGTTISSIQSLTLDLTEHDAAFTNAGGLDFFLTEDTTTSILPNISPLAFKLGSLPDGLGTQLTPNFWLGTQAFKSTGSANSGQLDSYAFSISGAAQTYLVNDVNANGDIRLIVAPHDANVSATFAGATNPMFAVPSLTVSSSSVSFVPEPSSFLTLLVGIPVLAAGFRARRAR